MKIKLALSFFLGCCCTFLLFLFMTGLVDAQGKGAEADNEYGALNEGVVCDFPLVPEVTLVEEKCTCWYLGDGKGFQGLGAGCNALSMTEETFGKLPKCSAR
ncbi:hypothetical protein [Microbulbifer pacificus]|uniref:Uncharacterized protein n=1 Tax=Microbulbifer pacificus TaxID=407164 RepID=A0AAU0MX15_9GAMM|nr:hypothetical protein [Microbulbifer pacificus]WOX05049.1 hypothetical protein R5R33_15070 [Microbulbifer pacificus]